MRRRETKKIHWRCRGGFATLSGRIMNLKPTLIVCLSAVALISLTGCNFFRKNKKPKENPKLALQVEEEFRERWMEKRAAELTGQGTDAATAQQQAAREFRERYPYIRAGAQ